MSLGEHLAQERQQHDNLGGGPKTSAAGSTSEEVRRLGPDRETARVPGGPLGRGDRQGLGQSQGQAVDARAVENRSAYRRGSGTGGCRPLTRCRAANTEGTRRQVQRDQNRTDAPRAVGGAEIGPLLLEHRIGEIRRCPPVDGCGAGSGLRSGGLGARGARARAQDRNSQPATQLRAHLLLNGIQFNYLGRWLGRAAIHTTLISLEPVPDPSVSLDRVP